MDDTSLGTRIRVERARQQLRQGDLARAAGMSPSALGEVEHDRREPTTRHLRALALALAVSADYLLGLTEDRTPWSAPPWHP